MIAYDISIKMFYKKNMNPNFLDFVFRLMIHSSILRTCMYRKIKTRNYINAASFQRVERVTLKIKSIKWHNCIEIHISDILIAHILNTSNIP